MDNISQLKAFIFAPVNIAVGLAKPLLHDGWEVVIRIGQEDVDYARQKLEKFFAKVLVPIPNDRLSFLVTMPKDDIGKVGEGYDYAYLVPYMQTSEDRLLGLWMSADADSSLRAIEKFLPDLLQAMNPNGRIVVGTQVSHDGSKLKQAAKLHTAQQAFMVWLADRKEYVERQLSGISVDIASFGKYDISMFISEATKIAVSSWDDVMNRDSMYVTH